MKHELKAKRKKIAAGHPECGPAGAS